MYCVPHGGPLFRSGPPFLINYMAYFILTCSLVANVYFLYWQWTGFCLYKEVEKELPLLFPDKKHKKMKLIQSYYYDSDKEPYTLEATISHVEEKNDLTFIRKEVLKDDTKIVAFLYFI